MNETPEVRHFLVCEDVSVAADRHRFTLHNTFQIIRAVSGDEFPLLLDRTCLYAVLTNGRGVHTFSFDLAIVVGGQVVVLGRSAQLTVDLGQDPLMVHGVPVRFPPIRFDRPGQYEFQLLCDGNVIARELFEVRASQ
jgi:hypothetical protein